MQARHRWSDLLHHGPSYLQSFYLFTFIWYFQNIHISFQRNKTLSLFMFHPLTGEVNKLHNYNSCAANKKTLESRPELLVVNPACIKGSKATGNNSVEKNNCCYVLSYQSALKVPVTEKVWEFPPTCKERSSSTADATEAPSVWSVHCMDSLLSHPPGTSVRAHWWTPQGVLLSL